MKKRIGLFGGSFNPIHNAHIWMMKHLLNKKIVDEIWIVPCKKHNLNKSLISAKYRLDMIRLAIAGMKKARISHVELKMRGKSCTLKTINKLEKNSRNNDFFLIIGADILGEIKKWYKYDELVKKTRFIIFRRAGYKLKLNPDLRIEKIVDYHGKISSTIIREMVRQGKSISKLVPKSVENYIKKNKIYT
jgi:nicotinate-nucleotide adenylyltransferase